MTTAMTIEKAKAVVIGNNPFSSATVSDLQ